MKLPKMTDDQVKEMINFMWNLRELLIELYPPYAAVAQPLPIQRE